MEINKPLRDWEMSCLAERMSPMEFDQIAVRYLEITKIRLDQIREDAGRNCITYMANSLIMWKDSLVQNKARQILYSKLTKAADKGLIARTSFRFLVTGEEDDDYEHFHGKGQTIWAKLNSKLRSFHSLFRVIQALFPVLTAVFLFVEFPGAEDIKLDSMSLTFLNVQTLRGSPGYHFIIGSITNMFPLFYTICIILFLIVCPCLSAFCLVCFHNTFYKGHQPKKRNRDLCSFVASLMFLLLYSLLIFYYFYLYTKLRYFEVPKEALADNMYLTIQSKVYDDNAVKQSWDKLQMGYECCGVHNYTDWTQVFPDNVPSSCCKKLHSSCGRLFKGLESINQAGCVWHLASHINHQVKLQSIYFLIYLVLAAFANVIIVVACLRKLFLVIKRNVACKACCMKGRENENETYGIAFLLTTDANDCTLPKSHENITSGLNDDLEFKVDNISQGSQATIYYSEDETK